MKAFGRLSIKRKLIFLMTFVSTSTLLLALISLIMLELTAAPKKYRNDLSTLAKIIGFNSKAALVFDDQEAAAEILAGLRAWPSILSAKIYTREGEFFAEYPVRRNVEEPSGGAGLREERHHSELKGKAKDDRWKSDLLSDYTLEVFEDIILNGERVGTVYLKMSMDEFHSDLWRYVNTFSIIFVFFIFISYIFARVLQGSISKPIMDLSQLMKTVSREENYSVRAEKTPLDELGILFDGFNEMLMQIQYRDKKLEQYREHLEEEVILRTKELLRANEELKRANAELRNTQSQLIQSAKLASIGELAAGVAHELNQPLLVIRGMVQFARKILVTTVMKKEELEEHLEMIERNTKRMMNVINHLRSFSRQSNTCSFSPVDINKVIENSFLMVGEQLRLHNIEIIRNLTPSLPYIRGDENQVEQVLLNLIMNARDAIGARKQRKTEEPGNDPSKPHRLEISTRIAEGTTDHIEVLIKDTGCGIPQEIGNRIFEPFFTTKEVGEGTGLGLSISYGIVREHGGEIGVVATDSEGTTFRIRLPAIGG